MAANEITIKVKRTSGGQVVAMQVASDLSITSLKEAIQREIGVAPAQQRLIHKGKILKDGEGLATYKVVTGETVLLQVTQQPTDGTAAAAPVAPASDLGTTTSTPAAAGASSSTTGMQAALDELASNPPEARKLGLETLLKVIDNIIQNPNEDKYRRLRPANAVFHRKLGGLSGGLRCIKEIGFSDGEEGMLALNPTTEAWHHLNTCRRLVQDKLNALARAPVPPPFPGAAGAGAGFPFAPPMGGMPGGIPPGMDLSQMARLASDPAFIQQAMSNPMLQQMVSGNPMLQQQLQALQHNPQMLQQAMANPVVQQMMSNPEMMQQAMQIMGSLGGGGMPGGMPGMPGAPGAPPLNPQALQQMMGAFAGTSLGGAPAPSFPPTPAAPTTSSQPAPATALSTTRNAAPGGNASGNPDEGKTEEELINEAIQRSLQEQ